KPVLARPIGMWENAARWARRKPTAAALLAVTALAIATLFGAELRYRFGMRDALRQTEAQKLDAQDNLRQALAAVDQMLTRVGERKLTAVPQTEAVRKELLQDAVAFYESFLAKRADDPELRHETALAYRRLGRVYDDLMQTERAAEVLGESVAR